MSKEYYVQKSRTLLGIGIFYLDESENKIKIISVDFVTELSSNAICVIACFNLMRKQNFFKKIEKKNYEIWCDCGPHFRNSQIVNYFLREFSICTEPINVNLNFFVEKHGKNARDSHFSVISNIRYFFK